MKEQIRNTDTRELPVHPLRPSPVPRWPLSDTRTPEHRPERRFRLRPEVVSRASGSPAFVAAAALDAMKGRRWEVRVAVAQSCKRSIRVAWVGALWELPNCAALAEAAGSRPPTPAAAFRT
ncbi:hypothetical protein I79_019683 [Cricetulus griseus]|uniref:Uncharacterized protein n=1 Tax=Cricetulus griseus TaxID=10029 RepID=G3I826_CRIGR|nr:hypothetical protein I79_019683 [Cricetulus griseus]